MYIIEITFHILIFSSVINYKIKHFILDVIPSKMIDMNLSSRKLRNKLDFYELLYFYDQFHSNFS